MIFFSWGVGTHGLCVRKYRLIICRLPDAQTVRPYKLLRLYTRFTVMI